MDFIKANLCEEGWPNLQCHSLKISFEETKVQEWTLFTETWEDSLDKTSETDFGKAVCVEVCKM